MILVAVGLARLCADWLGGCLAVMVGYPLVGVVVFVLFTGTPWQAMAEPWWLTVPLGLASLVGGLALYASADWDVEEGGIWMPPQPSSTGFDEHPFVGGLALGLYRRRGAVLVWTGLFIAFFPLGRLALDLVRRTADDSPLRWFLMGWANATLRHGWITPLLLCSFLLILSPLRRELVRFAGSANRNLEQIDPGRQGFTVYLRSFDEDELRVPLILGRVTLAEQMNPVIRFRFEEVLAGFFVEGEWLAISPPDQARANVGGNQMVFGNDEWQRNLESVLDNAHDVIISATPHSVNEGFAWELGTVAERESDFRVLLVLAPWPPEERMRRYRGFVETARTIPFFAPLEDVTVDETTRLLIHCKNRWHAVAAEETNEASYIAALEVWHDRTAERVYTTSERPKT